MHNSLLIAVLAGLGGMIGWGSADFFAKKAIDEIGPIKSLVWAHFYGTLILLAAFLLRAVFDTGAAGLPTNAITWGGLALFGALQMIVYWLVYQGFEKGRLSILNPVFASYSGIVAVFSILLLGEHANKYSLVALAIIFAGTLVLSLDFSQRRGKRIKLAAGLIEVGCAAVLAAVWTLGWDKFVTQKDPLSSALLMYAFMSLAAMILARIMRVKFVAVNVLQKNPLFLMGLGEAVAYLSISWGFSQTNLTAVVALISGAFSVPTVILAYIFLKERLNMLQFGAIITIIAGIVLLSVS